MKNLTDMQKESLSKLFNDGVLRASGILSEMLDTPIKLDVPSIKVISSDADELDIGAAGSDNYSVVNMLFKGPTWGQISFLFPVEVLPSIVGLMTKDVEVEDMEEVKGEVVGELGNVILNSVIGEIANRFGTQFQFSVPEYHEESFGSIMRQKMNQINLLANVNFNLEKLKVEANIMVLFEGNSFEKLLGKL